MNTDESTMHPGTSQTTDYERQVHAVLSEMDRAERETALWLVGLFAIAGYLTHDAARRWRRQSACLRA